MTSTVSPVSSAAYGCLPFDEPLSMPGSLVGYPKGLLASGPLLANFDEEGVSHDATGAVLPPAITSAACCCRS
jgi:hypothetical protein